MSHNEPLSNVWLGVSVEDQKHADQRIPILLGTPAAIRFISAEPLLGPLDLCNIRDPNHFPGCLQKDVLNGREHHLDDRGQWTRGGRLDWVIAGGESGPNARPMHPDWVRALRDQCASADVPFFFKQWGAWTEADSDRPTIKVEVDVYGFEATQIGADEILVSASGHCAAQTEKMIVNTPYRLMRRLKPTEHGHGLDGRTHLEWPRRLEWYDQPRHRTG